MPDKNVLVFDLGGVLGYLKDPVSTFGFSGSVDEFWEQWLGSLIVRSYELGEIDTEEFVSKVIPDLNLDANTTEFKINLDKWLEPPTEEVVRLLRALKPSYKLGLLSNTNSAHWGIITACEGFLDLFDKVFLSFETGFLKPDFGAYHQLANAFLCEKENIHFFDDNQINIDAAIISGIFATRVQGIDELKKVLQNY